MKRNPLFCLLQGVKVIEFVCRNPDLAQKAAYELGFIKRPKQVMYQLRIYLAPVKKIDYVAANRLFNLCITTNLRQPPSRQKKLINHLL